MDKLLQQLNSLSRKELYRVLNKVNLLLLEGGKDDKRILLNIIKRAIIQEKGSVRINIYAVKKADTENALRAVWYQISKIKVNLSRKEYVLLLHILVGEALRSLKEENKIITPSNVVRSLINIDVLMNNAFPDYTGEALLFAIKKRG